MDLYNQFGANKVGAGGIKCSCCDNGYSKKGKSKNHKGAFSQMRRTLLNRDTQKEVQQYFKDFSDKNENNFKVS